MKKILLTTISFILVLCSVLLCGCKTKKLTKKEIASIEQQESIDEQEESRKKEIRDEVVKDVIIYHFLFK